MSAALLWLLSAIWSSVSALARFLAAKGILRSARLPVPVIAVGNLQVGGAGKTPLVAQIAREAQERGLKVCILCRGYGGLWERSGGVIAPADAQVDPFVTGDEAALLHDLAPGAYIGVGSDRVSVFYRAQEKAGAPFDRVILDDGFQHWKIRKDVSVVALTSARRTEVLYRDWTRALRHAGLVVWTKGDRHPETWGLPCVRALYRFPAPGEHEDESLAGGRPLWLVTGLAQGALAFEQVRNAGYPVVRHIPFPDHARYAEPVVQELVRQATEAGAKIALTGKDWVKWRNLGVARAKVMVLEPRLEFVEGREIWDHVLWGSSS